MDDDEEGRKACRKEEGTSKRAMEREKGGGHIKEMRVGSRHEEGGETEALRLKKHEGK